MAQTYVKFHRSKREADGEFYSTKELVADFMEKIFADPKVSLKGAKICCPCDTVSSEFVKYFRQNFDKLGLAQIDCFADYYNPKVLDADYVITNPPFHQLNKWLKWLSANGKKWAVVKGFLNCYYNLQAGLILDAPETSYFDAGHWQFDRPDGTKKNIGVLYSSNFADYSYSKEPKTLTYSDYQHPTYAINPKCQKYFDAPVYYIVNAKKNGVPKDAKYIALSARFEVNRINGWTKYYTTSSGGNFGTIDGKTVFERIVWKKDEPEYSDEGEDDGSDDWCKNGW